MRVFDKRIVGTMHTVTLADAKADLDELMDPVQPGEAILMMDQGRPLAEVRKAERDSWPCKAGSTVGKTGQGSPILETIGCMWLGFSIFD